MKKGRTKRGDTTTDVVLTDGALSKAYFVRAKSPSAGAIQPSQHARRTVTKPGVPLVHPGMAKVRVGVGRRGGGCGQEGSWAEVGRRGDTTTTDDDTGNKGLRALVTKGARE